MNSLLIDNKKMTDIYSLVGNGGYLYLQGNYGYLYLQGNDGIKTFKGNTHKHKNRNITRFNEI